MAVIAFFASTWKWTYYAPNTLRVLLNDGAQREGGDAAPEEPRTLASMWKERALWERCLLPYAGAHFVADAPALPAARPGGRDATCW
jgi:hypothetical protein